jgi:hypothetical protein
MGRIFRIGLFLKAFQRSNQFHLAGMGLQDLLQQLNETLHVPCRPVHLF